MANQVATTAPNTQAPNLAGSQNNASQYFNNFFQGNFATNGNINDALNAFFEKYTGNAESGQALAATVLYTAQAQNLNPMVVLSEFQGLPQGQLNNYLAAFLNINRVPTSQIGIKTTPTTNSYITRSIIS
jgi:hypothetical protein